VLIATRISSHLLLLDSLLQRGCVAESYGAEDVQGQDWGREVAESDGCSTRQRVESREIGITSGDLNSHAQWPGRIEGLWKEASPHHEVLGGANMVTYFAPSGLLRRSAHRNHMPATCRRARSNLIGRECAMVFAT